MPKRVNGFQYALGQIGSGSARSKSVAMLLDEHDLPTGEWLVLDELSWRAGTIAWFSAESRRARRAGGFTAFRSFQDISTPKWVHVSVAPAASTADAVSLVPRMQERGLRNRQSISTVTEERRVEDMLIPDVPNAWIYEYHVTTPSGPGVARYVSGNIDKIVFGVGWSAPCRDDCSWDEVLSIATAQAFKIQRVSAAQ